MIVSKVMHKTSFLTPETSLKDAAVYMKKEHLGFTPITERGELLGVISDRDITIRAAANNVNMEKSLVKDYMTKKIFHCYENFEIEDAIKLMKKNNVHRLVVLDNEKNKKVIGVLSLNDIATKTNSKELVWEVAKLRSEEKFTH